MKNFEIILLAGYSCAGKTTLGKAFAEFVNIERIHQQSIYRNIASAKGYSEARAWLASVGSDIFIKETTEGVIEHIRGLNPSKGILIDETYNLYSVQKIQEAFPESRVTIVTVNAGEEIRGVRMAERIGGSPTNPEAELEFRDSFLRSAGLDQVIAQSNCEVYNKGFIDKTVSDLSAKLAILGISF